MKIDLPYLLMAFIIGAGIGVFYFGGLLWTVKRLVITKRPAMLSLGSFLLRMGLTLLCFYLVMGGRIEMLLASLFGFLIVRAIFVRRFKPVQNGLPAKRGIRTWI